MHHALDMHADVGVLESLDGQPAPVAMRKERVGVTRNLVEDWIVVAAGQWHWKVAAESLASSLLTTDARLPARPTWAGRRPIARVDTVVPTSM